MIPMLWIPTFQTPILSYLVRFYFSLFYHYIFILFPRFFLFLWFQFSCSKQALSKGHEVFFCKDTNERSTTTRNKQCSLTLLICERDIVQWNDKLMTTSMPSLNVKKKYRNYSAIPHVHDPKFSTPTEATVSARRNEDISPQIKTFVSPSPRVFYLSKATRTG